MKRSVFLLAALSLLATAVPSLASARDHADFVPKPLDVSQAGPFAHGTTICNNDLKGLTYSCRRPLPVGPPVTLGQLVSRHTTFEAAKRLNRWPAHFTADTLLPPQYRDKIYVASDIRAQLASR